MNSTVIAVKKNLDLTQNQPLKHSVYEAFRKTIILGDIPAGERINEKEFSDELNISRTPIRIAMQALVKEQLVQHVPRIGIVVKGIGLKDAYEIYAIRQALDTLATIQAMNLMTEADFTALYHLLQQGNTYHQTKQVDALLQNFSDFNTFIYEKSQMPRLRDIAAELQTYLIYFRDIAVRSSIRSKIALEEHWAIYHGMQTQDSEQVTLLIHNHLTQSLQFIVQEMEQRKID